MPYDESLANRIRPNLLTREGANEKHMFGGLAFLINGNMCCGVFKDLLIVRLSKEEGAKALEEPNVRPMDITGKPMRGWVLVEPAGLKEDKDLMSWIERAHTFAASLPKK